MNIIRFRQEINQDFINLARKVLPEIFLEVLTPQRGEHFIFSGRDYKLRVPTVRREQLVRSEDLGRVSTGRQNQQMTMKPVPTSGRVTLSILARAIIHSKCREDALLECSILFSTRCHIFPSLPVFFPTLSFLRLRRVCHRL